MNLHQSHPHVFARAHWHAAYRAARCLNLGTLHTQFTRPIALLALEAKDYLGPQPIMGARMFRNVGYYRAGFRRL